MNHLSPCLMVIFGASGDLTSRKLIPALYQLSRQGLLPPGTAVIGSARREKSDEEFRQEMRSALDQFSRTQPIEEKAWADFSARLHYVHADVTDPTGMRRLADRLQTLEATGQKLVEASLSQTGEKQIYPIPPCRPFTRLYYFATAPDRVRPAMEAMAGGGLIPSAGQQDLGHRYRIVVEKPFGSDLSSALELNQALQAHFHETDIFRIDHYLGKETVQNLLYFRFANACWEPLWNRRHVDHVQITVAEKIGVGTRGGYYDQAGALRDMVQNHVLQILCLVAMEPPGSLTGRDITDEKVKVLRALLPLEHTRICPRVVRGQYGPGQIGDQPTPGYRGEVQVEHDSMTETFVMLRLAIDNWRWEGVPFYLRTGKAMAKQNSSVAIVFKRPPKTLFELEQNSDVRLVRNMLLYRIQPSEGYSLLTNVKEPGKNEIADAQMDFEYKSEFPSGSPEAYERLLLDAIKGDTSLFIRNDQTEEAWRLIDAVRNCWAMDKRMPQYAPGSWGPSEANDLLAMEGDEWINEVG